MSPPIGSPAPVTVALDAPDSVLGRRLAGHLERAGFGVVPAAAAPEALVVLAPGPGPDVDGTGLGGVGVRGAREVLATTVARHVVVLSSAMVLGAWPDNPVPLTGAAPPRPNPGCGFAAGRLELEGLAVALRDRAQPAVVTVLRPCIVVVPAGDDPRRARRGGPARWMERSAWHARAARHTDTRRVAQYLHVDDLCGAVVTALRTRHDGTASVAPDGWIDEFEQLDLIAAGRPPRLPATVGRLVAAVRWWAGWSTTPPELHPYTRHPWVVANDDLRALGWSPSCSNAEALVLGHRPGWWSTLTPDRRQQVALGGLAGAVAATTGTLVALLRRGTRRRP